MFRHFRLMVIVYRDWGWSAETGSIPNGYGLVGVTERRCLI